MPQPELIQLATTCAPGQVQWVFALSIGKTWVHDSPSGEPVLLDLTVERAAFLVDQTKRMIESFEMSAAETESNPVRPPVLALHKELEGEFGHFLDAKLQLAGPKKGIHLKTRWNERFEAGRFSHVSCGIDGEFTVQSGEKFGPVIAELSLCTTPKDQRIGSLSEGLSVQLSRKFTLATEDPMTAEEMKALLDAALEPLATQQAEILERLDALEEEPEEDEDEKPEEDEEDEKPEAGDPDDAPEGADLASVKEELAALKEQNLQLAKKLQRDQGGKKPPSEPEELPKHDIRARQKALREKGVRGSANVAQACFTD